MDLSGEQGDDDTDEDGDEAGGHSAGQAVTCDEAEEYDGEGGESDEGVLDDLGEGDGGDVDEGDTCEGSEHAGARGDAFEEGAEQGAAGFEDAADEGGGDGELPGLYAGLGLGEALFEGELVDGHHDAEEVDEEDGGGDPVGEGGDVVTSLFLGELSGHSSVEEEAEEQGDPEAWEDTSEDDGLGDVEDVEAYRADDDHIGEVVSKERPKTVEVVA